MTSEIAQSLVSAYFTSMAEMNPEGLIQHFAPDAQIYDPVSNPASTPQEFRQFMGMLSNFFAQLNLSQDELFIVGNHAAVKWTMEAVTKNNRKATTEGISTFEINEAGKIQKLSSYWDEKAFMSQLKP